jgi:NAD(P)-dependent dehydrogenase (short-subunit alcohol dehydrogenase family)
VLGASSGFGESICLKLSEMGMNIVGVHLDRKSTLPKVEQIVTKIKANGVKAMFFNANAADPAKRAEILAEVATQSEGGIYCLVHSLAFGSLKPFVAKDASERITPEQMNMTCDVMAHSLVYWTQDLFARDMLKKGPRFLP